MRVALRSAFVLAFAVLFSLPSAALGDTAPPLVRVVGASSFDLAGDAGVDIPVPVAVRADVPPTDVVVRLADVTVGGTHTAAVAGRFAVAPALGPGPGPDRGVVVLTARPAGLRQGTYGVVLDVLRRSAPADSAELTVQVVRPAAALRTPATLVVDRTLPAWIFGAAAVDLTPLRLHETAGMSGLTGVTALQVDAARNGAHVAGGRLVFKAVPDVPPGGARSAGYSLAGSFPLGTTTGTVEVDAPQLAAPVQVAFEVHTRRDALVVPFVIVLGLLTGYAARTALARRIDVAKVRVQADGVLRRLRTAAQASPDRVFRAAVEKAAADLEQALQNATPADTPPATTAADTALRSATDDLRDRTAQARAELAALSAVAGTTGALPQAVTAVLVAARPDVEKAKTALEGGDVTGARATVTATADDLRTRLRQAVDGWRLSVQDAVSALGGAHPAAVPSDVAERVKAATDAAAAALDAAALTDGAAPSADLLRACFTAREQLRAVVRAVREAASAARFVVDDLPQASALREPLQRTVALLSGMLDTDDVESAVTSAPARLDDMLKALDGAVRAEGEGLGPDDRTSFDSLVEAGRYRDALTLARAAAGSRRRQPGGVTVEAFTGIDLTGVSEALGMRAPGAMSGAVADTVAALTAPAAMQGTPLRQGTPLVVVAPSLRMPDAIDVQTARDIGSLMRARIFQTVILGAVLVLVGTLLYGGDTFVGTFQQIAGIFLWSFALDIGADVAVQQIKALNPAAAVAK